MAYSGSVPLGINFGPATEDEVFQRMFHRHSVRCDNSVNTCIELLRHLFQVASSLFDGLRNTVSGFVALSMPSTVKILTDFRRYLLDVDHRIAVEHFLQNPLSCFPGLRHLLDAQ